MATLPLVQAMPGSASTTNVTVDGTVFAVGAAEIQEQLEIRMTELALLKDRVCAFAEQADSSDAPVGFH